ncbi:MAG: AbrB/MazE/SpoVT family DNA-binding domain-containing protein [Ruminococcaceae bacterium]|nr:AbrB/MazE/SpoVT family DNA-binding domain-containing protein [Oscillospiraceae bacterium]
MKSTGMIRPVDKNGRVVIPRELRKQFGIVSDVDSFEIFTEDDKIILKKYQPCCIFCNESDEVIKMHGQPVCLNCIDRLTAMKNSL